MIPYLHFRPSSTPKKPPDGRQLLFHSAKMRALTLLTSCLVLISAGTLFTFSLYSKALRSHFGYSSADVNLIAGVGNTAVYLSFLLVGPIYDHWGSTVTMILAFVTSTIGYGCVWAAISGHFSITSVTVLCVLYFLIGVSSTAAYLAVVGINMINFPPERTGLTLGILLLFYGLSGTINSQVFAAFYSGGSKEDASGYILFLWVSLAIMNGIGCFTIFPTPYAMCDYHPIKKTGSSTPKSLQVAPINGMKTNSSEASLLMPEHSAKSYSATSENSTLSAKRDMMVPPSSHISESISPSTAETLHPESFYPLQILKSKYFWIYALVCIWQQGLTYVTNIGTIIAAASGPTATADSLARACALHVTLFSIGQSIGRFCTGAVSDLVKTKYHHDRTMLLVVSESVIIISHAFVAFMGTSLVVVQGDGVVVTTGLLYFCTIGIGLGWGSAGAMFPSIIKDLFGTAFYGTACGFVMMAVPVGVIVSNLVFGNMYDAALQAQPKLPNGDLSITCYGSQCFTGSFGIALILQAIPVILAVVMYYMRTKEAHRQSICIANLPAIVEEPSH
ncbi:hypothetical protein BATDEDRAFT_91916 [Batrachochytrium dendrobatidis JAM81]|uniref:Uncharacterized protein n=2 Tax=Batrachochytrium dendrobatidis TaxID=109871 RepID=F4PCH7_BATDJ|nr:uncharacterized protein BATDEDRAFT_91916 [Batrachochytrium dendrobatidis JAM81]EGF77091.1 hypothetical protein BATDEDRAFT_91916 [Batrachochytrium dendrobatidis JAM81]KAJ8330433.1 hypothetical protein O5D80_001422 [Batrachochytrium dendrobatidis]KAK5665415.1 hypothetical protein QVD99_007766 [Batrachochytrium dendrobatidis]OAJ44777.1 hypothetical protein BDEG_27972 [Batrachochytrium dendrobatidis JEL423]|eukprot:XP_006682270.1 hypothetical protein BATDEDRAFT_91916 [Batrachochytrium dendrobatidis JAM81]